MRWFVAVVCCSYLLNDRFQNANETLSEKLFNPLLTEIEEDEFASADFDGFFARIDSIYTPVNEVRLPLKNNYWETLQRHWVFVNGCTGTCRPRGVT